METLGLLKLASRAAINNVCFQEEEQSSPMTDLRAHSRPFVRGRIQIVSFWPTGSRKTDLHSLAWRDGTLGQRAKYHRRSRAGSIGGFSPDKDEFRRGNSADPV